MNQGLCGFTVATVYMETAVLVLNEVANKTMQHATIQNPDCKMLVVVTLVASLRWHRGVRNVC